MWQSTLNYGRFLFISFGLCFATPSMLKLSKNYEPYKNRRSIAIPLLSKWKVSGADWFNNTVQSDILGLVIFCNSSQILLFSPIQSS